MPKTSKAAASKDIPSDLRDMLLVDAYKLAMTRAQVEALAEILIKKKIMTYEEFWKITNEKFKNSKV